jgi:serine/threonine protein kinase
MELYGINVSVLRESAVLRSLKHPGIVELIDIVQSGNKMMFILELCGGGTLRSFVNGFESRGGLRPLPWDQLRQFTRQLVEAVAYMHGCRIAHRDIKPDNIVLHGSYTVKLCDFGMARVVRTSLVPNDMSIQDDSNFTYTTKCTTLGFRPPELIMEAKNYDPYSVDRWGLGCVIAEMVQLRQLVCDKSEVFALQHIFQLLGTPTETTWPGVSMLKGLESTRIWPQRTARLLFSSMWVFVPPDVMTVMDRMLRVVPYKRMMVSQALKLMKKTADDEWEKAESLYQRKERSINKRRRILY